MSEKLKINICGLVGASSLFALSLPATAQDVEIGAEQSVEQIVVTGSRIRGIEVVGSPVTALTREDIEQSSATTTTELLSQLPQVFNFGATDASFTSANNQNANRTFGNGINLRGLGTESTLTLLDGRRLPAAGTQSQFFDPSVIPTMAIERLEVLADGSSGIYGSDAVAGAVNILLRKDFDGIEVMARTKHPDGFKENQYGLAIGKMWDSGSFMISGEYNKRDTLFASDRDFYTDDLSAYGGPDFRSTNSAPGNITVGGISYAIPSGNGENLTASDFTAGTQNLQSRYLGAGVLPEQERSSAAFTLEQEVTDTIEFYAHGFYAERDGVVTSTALSASFVVPESNAFFVNPGAEGEAVSVAYSFVNELGFEQNASSQVAYHITAGLNFELSDSWSGNVFYARGFDEERSLTRDLGAGPRGGVLAAALADSNPATAFNPFSSTGNNDLALINSFVGTFRVDTDYAIDEYGVSADGPVATLPAGEVRMAVGASRQEINWKELAPFQTSTDRTVNSMFGEVFVPILGGDGPELNMSLAARYDDYDDVGDTFNPKVGGTFRPTDSLVLRASYGTSFRAPTLADTGSPFNQWKPVGSAPFGFTDAEGNERNVLYIRGGNPDLVPEEATTYSVGADWSPVSVEGLSLSVTYYNVDYSQRIATPGNNYLALQLPELAPIVSYNPDQARIDEIVAQGLFSRPIFPGETVDAIVDGRKVNLGANKTDGLEFSGNYDAAADWGTWRAGINATKILSFDRSIITGTPLRDALDTINNPASFIARAYTGAQMGNISGNLVMNHYGSYVNDSVSPNASAPSHTEFDLSLRYTFEEPVSFAESITFSLDIQDLFDNNPPYVQNGTLAFDPNAHNPIGRTIAIGVRAKMY